MEKHPIFESLYCSQKIYTISSIRLCNRFTNVYFQAGYANYFRVERGKNQENEVSQLSARRFVEELAICQDCGLFPGLSTTCPGDERTKLAS